MSGRRKLLSLILIFTLFVCACAPAEPERKQYNASFLTLFDTVTTIVGRAESEEAFQEILKDVVTRRAKLRALHLLNDMGRTELQLRQKLKQSDYTEEVIEEVIRYVKSFGYVNDEEYARHFILNRKEKKSRKELYIQLSQKGLSSQLLEDIFEECYDENASKEAIYSIMCKKKFHPETASRAEVQKMLSYLTRKGFSYEDIRQVLQVNEWNA